MKLHPIATVLLAIATRNAVSAKKTLRGPIEFDSEDVASENFPNYEDYEDMIFNYDGRCRYYGSNRQTLTSCCTDEFYECKDDKHHGFRTPNCARQKQQCFKFGLVVEAA
ncbi:hypothetical protein QTG54_016934 [Skeletonema marinoi]|uniref:Uncharacterized protein n=1 Tax=Skeletonema marinoi TaxID=267567 RepID=A0AAD8XRC0_9STRA|nr:hypothetical protein QTG54_016934 [Skeletonema marinoi]